MIKLSNILSEIGEGTAQSFKWKADTNFNTWLKKTIEMAKSIVGSMKREVPVNDFTYSFTSDITNTIYSVYIKSSVGNRKNRLFTPGKSIPKVKHFIECTVGFRVKSSKQEEDTNLNEQYRIMATVTQCIFDFIKRLEESGQVNLSEMYILPKADNSNDSSIVSKRGRMYAMYIDKMLSKIPSSRKFSVQNTGFAFVITADVTDDDYTSKQGA